MAGRRGACVEHCEAACLRNCTFSVSHTYPFPTDRPSNGAASDPPPRTPCKISVHAVPISKGPILSRINLQEYTFGASRLLNIRALAHEQVGKLIVARLNTIPLDLFHIPKMC